MNQKEIQHFFNRACFGATYQKVKSSLGKSREQLFNETLAASADYEPIDISSDLSPLPRHLRANPAIRNEYYRRSALMLKDLSLDWMERMAADQGAMREKMSLFWHGHFACKLRGVKTAETQINVIRKHALGSFRDLLLEMTHNVSLLRFLTNTINVKGKPNENFARELMELFTLGTGNFNEQDIKEVARAYTGHSKKPGPGYEFAIIWEKHDQDEKTVFGKTGNFTGDDVVELILERRECAKFITTRIWKYFVHEEVPEDIVDELAREFYDSGYQIPVLLKRIYTSDFFYHPLAVGSRVRSPVELVVTLMKQCNLLFDNPDGPKILLSTLGQVPFAPPNVGGWYGGKGWVDATSLLHRLKFPLDVFRLSDPELSGGISPNDLRLLRKNEPHFEASIDWEANLAPFRAMSTAEATREMISWLFPFEPKGIDEEDLVLQLEAMPHELAVKYLYMLLPATPEFQLC